MTIQEALNFTNVYLELSSFKIPFTLAFKLHKINKEASSASEFYKKKMEEIIENFGEKDEAGNYKITDNGIAIKPDKVNECGKKIEELGAVKWETEDLRFTEEERGLLENLELTPAQWEVLFCFI